MLPKHPAHTCRVLYNTIRNRGQRNDIYAQNHGRRAYP